MLEKFLEQIKLIIRLSTQKLQSLRQRLDAHALALSQSMNYRYAV